ncbi:glycosyltransferase family 2 protein [bacterium]|nr:glycosyltransferase family 2 protein [bacterium]
MTITCIIATFNREQLLARSVETVLAQQLDAEFEVIVLNDAGEPLQPADWQNDSRVSIYNTNRVNRCYAWNAALAMAKGEYIHISGDDDYMLPGAYAALLARARQTGAEWTYGAYNCVNDDGEFIETILPTMEGDLFAHTVADIGIPMGASLMSRTAVLSVGGMDPELIPGQDRDLTLRIALFGKIAACQDIVAAFRVGPQGATTTPWSRSAQTGRIMREKCFANPRCLPRLFESISKAKNRGALRGRLARFYGASAIRHVRCSPFTALSRALVAVRFCLAGVPDRCFFRGLRGGW